MFPDFHVSQGNDGGACHTWDSGIDMPSENFDQVEIHIVEHDAIAFATFIYLLAHHSIDNTLVHQYLHHILARSRLACKVLFIYRNFEI
jgi:hypothetical protein